MSWVQVVMAVLIGTLVIVLVHDFFAGLDEERLWSDPALEDPGSSRNRAAAAKRTRPATTSVTSVQAQPNVGSTAVGSPVRAG